MYLDNAYLFQGMREETRRKILEAATEESYAAKDFLFHQGDPARNLYILIEGRVRISVGPQDLLAHVASDPGDVTGWSSLMENNSYTASAECLVPVKVLKIANSQLDQILQQDPASGMIFFKRLAALIGRRLVKCYKATLSLHGEREPRSYG
jgi:CRP/FNR family transcriptional regulator, cyclic AMP receptor protein